MASKHHKDRDGRKYRSSRERPDKHAVRSHRGDKRYAKRHSHRHYANKHRGHKHRYGHKYRHHDHSPVYVVNDTYLGHRGRVVDLDDLRFMVGIHTGNFDVIFRD